MSDHRYAFIVALLVLILVHLSEGVLEVGWSVLAVGFMGLSVWAAWVDRKRP